MTNDPQAVCRKIAEAIWDALGTSMDHSLGYDEKSDIDEIANAILNHTVVPEMVELCRSVEKIKEYGQPIHLIARATAILKKLEIAT